MVRLSTLAPCLFAIVLLGMHLGMRVLFRESLQVAWCPRRGCNPRNSGTPQLDCDGTVQFFDAHSSRVSRHLGRPPSRTQRTPRSISIGTPAHTAPAYSTSVSAVLITIIIGIITDPTGSGAIAHIDEAQRICLRAGYAVCNGISSMQDGPNGTGWYTQAGRRRRTSRASAPTLRCSTPQTVRAVLPGRPPHRHGRHRRRRRHHRHRRLLTSLHPHRHRR